jgi:pyruvate/2-oxoglutarate/acetoin dehydrogenase E1 component
VPEMTLVAAVRDALACALAADPRVVVFGEDVGRNGGVFRATDGLQERFGEERVADTPLAESAIVGTAIGMAAYGLRPVAEIQFMGFILPAVDQLISHAARLRHRSRGRFTCPLVVRAPYGGGIRAPELHSESLEALFVHVPGLKVVVPSTPRDAKGLLLAAIADPDPVIFMEPIRLYRAVREDVPAEPFTVPIGTARVARAGDDVTVVAWGNMVPVALRAAAAVAEEGIAAEVIDLRSLAPLDEATLVGSVRRTGRAVVVHEAARTGGFGAELAARIAEGAFLYLEAPVARVAPPEAPYPAYALEDRYLPGHADVAAAIRATVRY